MAIEMVDIPIENGIFSIVFCKRLPEDIGNPWALGDWLQAWINGDILGVYLWNPVPADGEPLGCPIPPQMESQAPSPM